MKRVTIMIHDDVLIIRMLARIFIARPPCSLHVLARVASSITSL